MRHNSNFLEILDTKHKMIMKILFIRHQSNTVFYFCIVINVMMNYLKKFTKYSIVE